jgi:hypothetical protein
MDLPSAIKSGKRFRRDVYPWIEVVCGGMCVYAKTNDIYYFNATEILAQDWIIESPSVTITREQFWGAYADAQKEAGHALLYPKLLILMAHKLGLGEDKEG